MRERLIDLSHTIRPGREQRKFETEMVQTDQVVDQYVLPGQWYIMHYIKMISHIGTHIEVPYHINQSGADTASVSLERLVGEGVRLDLRGLPAGTAVSLAQLQSAVEAVGGLHEGDLVLLQTGWDVYWGQPEYEQAPYVSPEAMRWLVAQKVGLVGIDTGGAEVPKSRDHVNHHIMLDHGVPHIENLRNLGALSRSRFLLFAAPLAVAGLESMPLRVVAWETEA